MRLVQKLVRFTSFIQSVICVATTSVLDFSKATNSSCENILRFSFPDLCQLHVSQGSTTVRGLRLVYWHYRAIETGSDDSGRGVPIIMVHGGPAWGHDYMLPLKQQACRGRDVVFYDQVGCGASAVPPDPKRTAPWLFTIDYYTEELHALVGVLGWQDFHFVGNSWGTIIGQAYGFKQDPRLRGIVLSGPISDAQLYIRSQWDPKTGSLGSLPPYMQHLLRQLEASQAFCSQLYAAEDSVLGSYFTSRTTPIPDCLVRCTSRLDTSNTSNAIYVGMQGSSEFTIGGVLSTLNFTGRLPQIGNPVLLTFGKYDTMRPATVDALFNRLPLSWKALMPHSGHATMLDDPKLMNDVIGEFFDRVEAGSFKNFDSWISASVEAAGGPAATNIDLIEAPVVQVGVLFSSTLRSALLLIVGAVIGAIVGPRLFPRLSHVAANSEELRLPFVQDS